MNAETTNTQETQNTTTPSETNSFADIASFISEAQLLKTDVEAAEDVNEETENLETEQEQTGEQNEETTEEVSEETSEEENQEEELDPQSKLPKSVQKRIDKLTAKNKEATERAEQAEAKIKELEGKLKEAENFTAPSQPTREEPLADVLDAETLQQRVANAKQVKMWALKNLNGATVEAEDGKEVEYSAEQMREFLARAEEVITEHAPQRALYLKRQQGWEEVARKEYPQIFQKDSEEYQEVMQSLKLFPEIRRFPDWKVFLGDYMVGRKLREKKAAEANSEAKKKPGTKVPLAPKVPESKPPVRINNEPKKRVENAKQQVIESSGSADALESYFSAAA